jgi:hypothetical protein
MYYNNPLLIAPSARRHGVDDEDITHAIEHVLATEDAGEEPAGGWSSVQTEPATCSK